MPGRPAKEPTPGEHLAMRLRQHAISQNWSEPEQSSRAPAIKPWRPPEIEVAELPATREGGGVAANTESKVKVGKPATAVENDGAATDTNGQMTRKPFHVRCDCGEWVAARAAVCPSCGGPRPARAKSRCANAVARKVDADVMTNSKGSTSVQSQPSQPAPRETPQTATAAIESLLGQIHVPWATDAVRAILRPLDSDQRNEVLGRCGPES
jgi:hypothetical protein